MSRMQRRDDDTRSHDSGDSNSSGRRTSEHGEQATGDHGALDDTGADDAMIDECIEELDELIMSLDRYPPAAVAVAMGAHLEGLLGALLDERLCTAAEVRGLLRRIESGALQEEREERGPSVTSRAPGP